MNENTTKTRYLLSTPLIKTLLISTFIFMLIVAIGLGLFVSYERKLGQIAIDCGANISESVKSGWTASCTKGYARYHMGIRQWGAPIFLIGVVGTSVTLVWLGVASAVYRKRSGNIV